MPRLRVVTHTPSFQAEYALRLSVSISVACDVLLLSDSEMWRFCEQATLKDAASAIDIRTARANSRISQALYIVSTVYNIVRYRPHIVHFQEYPEWHHYVVVQLIRLFAPIVLTVHDPQPHSGRDREYGLKQQRIRDAMRAAADMILVNGEFCKNEMESIGSSRPVVVSRHGVLLVPSDTSKRQPDARRILLFGRMEAYKGVETFVDAVEQLVQRGTPVIAVLAGSGPELGRLSNRISNIPNAQVRSEFLTPVEAIKELQMAKVVVLPYLDATQSGVAAAAFANGRPVIASEVGGISEVVVSGANGLLVQPGNAAALADAIEHVLNSDVVWNQLREGAERTARTVLNWDEIADDVVQHYYYLLNRT
jgi:glycosyltransferase involved in cell wall biosynthesis